MIWKGVYAGRTECTQVAERVSAFPLIVSEYTLIKCTLSVSFVRYMPGSVSFLSFYTGFSVSSLLLCIFPSPIDSSSLLHEK